MGNGEWNKLLQNWIPNHLDSTGAQALLLLNHPSIAKSTDAEEYGRDDFPSFEAWRTALDARAELINMVNGPSHDTQEPGSPSEAEFLRYLNLGFHVAPTADQDNHRTNWGNAAETRTGVIAPSLTKAAILEALRARHVYASTDRNLKVIARVNGNLMGAQLTGTEVPAIGATLSITIEIQDENEPLANYDVQVFRDTVGGDDEADVVKVADGSGDGTINVPGVTYTGGSQYFFFKIIQSDDDAVDDIVWTAPIWFEPNVTSATPIVSSLSLTVDLVREEAWITNTGSAEANISRWVLLSTQGNQRFTFPQNFRLPAGRSVKVTSGASAVQSPPSVLRWTTDFVWRNAGDPAELQNRDGEVVARAP